VTGPDLHIKALFKKPGTADQQIRSFGYNAGKIVRETTGRIRDIRPHLKHDDFGIFVAPASLGCSRSSRGNTPYNYKLYLVHYVTISVTQTADLFNIASNVPIYHANSQKKAEPIADPAFSI
jgi:hypothetical protein